MTLSESESSRREPCGRRATDVAGVQGRAPAASDKAEEKAAGLPQVTSEARGEGGGRSVKSPTGDYPRRPPTNRVPQVGDDAAT